MSDNNNDDDFPLEACKRFLERQFGQDLVLPIYKWIIPYPKDRAQLIEWVDEWVDDPDCFVDHIGSFDTSQVTDFSDVCSPVRNYKLQRFDEELKWDFSNAVSMADMFSMCCTFKGLGADQWDVSNVTNMERTFNQCLKFNGDVSGWNVSNATTMRAMFNNCTSFDCNLSAWEVSNVGDMDGMFTRCTSMTRKPIWYARRRR